MQIDDRLVHDIKLAECVGGVPNLTAYKDSKGFWTIGYGHLMADQGHDHTGNVISAARADALLQTDLASAKMQACQLPEYGELETDCRRNALIELMFNLGPVKWEHFKVTRNALQHQQWSAAALALKDSVWYTEVGPTRGDRIADYLEHGTYPNGA